MDLRRDAGQLHPWLLAAAKERENHGLRSIRPPEPESQAESCLLTEGIANE